MNRIAASLALLASLSWVGAASAHERFEIDGAVGYRWGGRVKVQDPTGGDATPKVVLDPGISYSAILGYRAQQNGFAFLSFSRAQTDAKVLLDGNKTTLGKMAVEYYQLGGNLETTIRWLVPYFGASVGFARFAAVGQGRDRVFFATVLDGGFKFDLHRNVHLRLLGRFPIVFVNGDLYCDTGRNCTQIDQFSPFVQGEVQLGLGVSF